MDKMREDFERFAGRWQLNITYDPDGYYVDPETQGAWLTWQHLYPMVEAAYRDGVKGFVPLTGVEVVDKTINQHWDDCAAKARLEGKDD